MRKYVLGIIVSLLAVSVRCEPLHIVTDPAKQARQINANFVDIDQNKQDKLSVPYDAKTLASIDGGALRRYISLSPYPLMGADESAALHIKVDPLGISNQIIGIYGEITSEQQDTEAAFMKVVSNGAGDAIYTALFADSGVGFEAASFHDGTKGIISTMQQDGCPYSVLYNGYWGYVVPLYGMMYLDQSPGNAIRIRPTPLAAADQEQISIWEPSISSTTFSVTTDGTTKVRKLNMYDVFTPTGTTDISGNISDVTRDDNYIYVKTSAGWKRSALSTW